MRLISFPISALSWANINFILCHSESDISYPYFGKYYLYMADHYLNLASIVVFISVLIEVALVYILIKYPYLKIR